MNVAHEIEIKFVSENFPDLSLFPDGTKESSRISLTSLWLRGFAQHKK